MSIASEITRINNNIANAYTQCSNKGATMPATQNSDNLANTISTISGGGGGDLSEYFKTEYTSNTGSNNNITNQLIKKIPNITFDNNVNSLSYAFYHWASKTLELPILNLTGITNLSYMFAYAGNENGKIEELDLSKFTNVNSITNVSYMFNNAKIKSIKNLSTLNTSNITNVECMFLGFAGNDNTLDLSIMTNWKPTSIKEMFRNTYELNAIDLRNLDTSSTTNMSGLFQQCTVPTLYLSGLDTSKVEKFSSSFQSMTLKYLDISNFTNESATNMNYMFGYSTKITTLDISGFDFSTPPTSFTNMFTNCGTSCTQADGAYANKIPYVYVKDATAQNWVLTAANGHPTTWTTDNVVVKQS